MASDVETSNTAATRRMAGMFRRAERGPAGWGMRMKTEAEAEAGSEVEAGGGL